MRSLARTLFTALLLAGALVLGARGVALAHAALVRAEPAAGSRLARAPARVRLVFSEELEPGLARLTLVGTGGAAALAAAPDPRDAYAVVAPIDEHLAPGAYRVLWRVVSADGHPVAGSVGFVVLGAPGSGAAGVGAAAPQAQTTREPPDDSATSADGWGPALAGAPVLPALLRGLALGCLTALAGMLGFAAWPRTRAPAGAGRLATGLAVAAPLFLALHLAAWAANASPEHALAGEGAAAALASGAGRVELWRTALAGLALWAVALARRPGLALAFALGALVAGGAAGHAAAIRPLVAVPAKVVHVVAVAAWLGGLLWLLLALGDRAEGHAGDGARLAAARRVSNVALVAAVAVALSGVVQAYLFLPSAAALAGSAYGRLALAKVAGLLGLVAFGAHHRFRALPRLAAGAPHGAPHGASDESPNETLRATLRREVVLMTAVVLLSGLLAYVPTPAAPSASRAVSTDTHP